MKRPTSSSRKINEDTLRITLPESKLEDSELDPGDWAEVRLISTGRNSGQLRIKKPELEEAEEE